MAAASTLIASGEAGIDDFNNPSGNVTGLANTSTRFNAITTIARGQVPFGAGTTLSKLRVNFQYANGGTNTWFIINNGSSGSQTVSSTAGSGTLEDTTHQDTISSGNAVCTQFNRGSGFVGVPAISYTASGYAGPTANMHTPGGAGTSVTANATKFYDPAGESGESGTDGASKFRFKAMTATYLSVYVDTNTFNQTQTFTLRENAGTDLHGSVSFSSAVTGNATDTTHSDSVVDNDTICIKGVNTATSGSMTIFNTSFWQTFGTTETLCLQGPKATGYSDPGTTTYCNPCGYFLDNITTFPTDGTINCVFVDFPATWLNLRFADLSGVTGTNTITSRITGSTGNQTLAINVGQTGDVEDVTHTDSITSGNYLSYQIAQSASSGFQARTMTSQLNGNLTPNLPPPHPKPKKPKVFIPQGRAFGFRTTKQQPRYPSTPPAGVTVFVPPGGRRRRPPSPRSLRYGFGTTKFRAKIVPSAAGPVGGPQKRLLYMGVR